MRNDYYESIYRKGDTLFVESLSNPRDISQFLKETQYAFTKSGFDYLNLNFSKVRKVFPNACVPVSSLIHFYRKQGYEIKTMYAPNLLKIANFDDPLEPRNAEEVLSTNLFSKIWKFTNSRQVALLTEAYSNLLVQKVECEKGVVDAFLWCLNEIMDNVLQHSESSEGFIMIQVHPETKKVAICLSDNGIGIMRSLSNSRFKPQTVVDAITMAMKEGVTRDTSLHQGNGLWGLDEIIRENNGTLTVKSGTASVFHDRTGEVKTYGRLPPFQGTIIDFQLNTSKVISLSKALSGHEPISLRLEAFENDRGDLNVDVKEHSHGTGTRIAAQQLKNLIVTLVNEKKSKVIVNFEGIGIISSSFADELIGKLVVKYGFFNFQQVIGLKGMNETVQVIVHRSVAQRMMESLRQDNNAI